MNKKTTIGKKKLYRDKVLGALLLDPTRSVKSIAKDLKIYRQAIWKEKRELETSKAVWGYTAVVDDSKLNRGLYQILLKTKPLSNPLVDLIIKRISERAPQKQDVQIKNALYVNGEYDIVICFSAPNHATARRYYNSIRTSYQKFLLEKPIMINVDFSLVREGKTNPDLEKLRELVPL